MNRLTRSTLFGVALAFAFVAPSIISPAEAHAAAKKKKKGKPKKGAKDEETDATPAEESASGMPAAEPATPAAQPEPAAAQPAPAPAAEPAPAEPAAEPTPAPVEPTPTPTPAADPLPVKKDRARFRGGVAAQGGALIAPGIITLGLAGVQGQLGAQINNLIGVYAVPGFDICFGPLGGVNISGAILVDFTVANDFITVGVGPTFSFFAAIGVAAGGASASAGGLYGGRIHAALNLGGRGDDGIRRKAFVIGIDTNLVVGAVGFAAAGSGGATAAGGIQFVIEPMLTLGYQAF